MVANSKGEGGAEAVDELATFFEVSLDMLVIRDMDLRIGRVNASWERVLGYSMAELEGIEMLSLVHPDDIEATLGHMKRMETEDEVHGFVNRYRHKDGGWRDLEWRAKRVGARVYGAARDVTERRAMEASLAASRETAEAASRAKSDFLANISHEIRTPLNGVTGLIGVLSRTRLSEEQEEIVDLIESSGATLERLLSDLLDVAKIEAGSLALEMRPFGLNGLYSVLDTYRVKAREKGLAFELKREAPAGLQLVGDVTRLRQVLGNLLSNAVKFTAAGKITTRIAAHAGEDGRVLLALEVEDSGIGFDAAFADALFGRFNQADASITRQFGGTGLGLSICRSLVEMMGGTIEASSEPGRGSLFRVVAPLRPAAPAQRSAVPAETPRALSTGPLRILLAEDHPINQRVVQLVLQDQGVILTTVENGAEAVAAFRAAPFDLVLMDMQMPVMDGLAAVRAIRTLETGRRTPIAMLSANAHPQHHQASLAAGADLHIAKPITAEALIAGIGRALHGG